MNDKTIFALGFFDGVHLGHQALLSVCNYLAETYHCKSGAITFSVHPQTLVNGNAPALLNTSQDRQILLAAYGMETVYELPFDENLMTTHWSDFLQQLIDLGAAGFVCGDDFRFGANGEGTADLLIEYCQQRHLAYGVVPDQVVDGEKVSSTQIRQLLKQGQVEQANQLLGHPHLFTGTVVSGRQLGRTLGFPTANLPIPEGLLIPKFGVYACSVAVDDTDYPAVMNIGTRPTVNGADPVMEIHLLDFDGDLYGKELFVTLRAFLRPEQKFDSLEELQAEIQKNACQARLYFQEIGKELT